jgi:hypothetical protein
MSMTESAFGPEAGFDVAQALAEKLVAEYPARLAYYEKQYGPQTGDGPNEVRLARSFLAALAKIERLKARLEEVERAERGQGT